MGSEGERIGGAQELRVSRGRGTPRGLSLERLAEGLVESITQNGAAAMVVMSLETYGAMRAEIERGPLWDQAFGRIGEGPSRDGREVIHEVAVKLGLKL